MTSTVVLLSGGLDSTVCAFMAAKRGDVHTLTVSYGQRHWVEYDVAVPKIRALLYPRSHRNANLGTQDLGLASLLTGRSQPGPEQKHSPYVVPGRNLYLLTMAATHAQALGADRVYIGSCAEDQDGFPDCRREFFQAAEMAIRFALDYDFKIVTPVIDRTKRQIWEMARDLGPDCLRAAKLSWSCYEPVKVGKCNEVVPCEKCPACVKREKGRVDAGI